MDLENTIKLLALQNALKFKGKANPEALIGGVIKEFPDAKSDVENLMTQINSITQEINRLSLDGQKKLLLELDPEFESKQRELKTQRKEKANSLPDLPNAEVGKVVTRVPPEPSKYTHLGHAMSFLINSLYAKKYEGKVILRLDDTNPEKETQEYVDAIDKDIGEYLGIEFSQTIFASDHMDQYLSYAQKLIDGGNAYVCNCTDIATHRREMKDCPHRKQEHDETQKIWNQMREGKHEDYVLRLAISMQHKNAVMRDPVIFRVVKSTHYRQGDKYKIWPMYDFETAIEEGLCGVTHVLRSNEFDQRIELHNYIASLFGFPEVTYKHYGRYNVEGATTKGREIRDLIESGDYIGWDDPRLVTLTALRRRGIVKEAYYKLAQQIGLSKQQTNLDFGVIAAVNRNLLDETAKRFFGVLDPVVVSVGGVTGKDSFSLSYHPHGKKGERKLSVVDSYYLEKKDHGSIAVGETVRFIDSMTVKKVSEDSYEFVSFDYDSSTKLKLIHYVPKDGNEVKGEILLPDLKQCSVVCESGIGNVEVNEVIQFERYAFCRLDAKESDKLKFWFTHE